MKAFKLILTTLLFLASFAAEAQNVVIYKDGNIVREYTAEQVDSVVYVPAKEVKYYYYVGTVQPTAENDSSNWKISNTDAGFETTVVVPTGESWLVYPNTWNYTAINTVSNDKFEWNAFVSAAIKNSIPGYTIKKMKVTADVTIKINFTKL